MFWGIKMNKKINLIMLGGITSCIIMVIITFIGITFNGSYTAIENNNWILFLELSFAFILFFWWMKKMGSLAKERSLKIEL